MTTRMLKKPISLSIFFPAYNEEANIEHSVREAKAVVEQITDMYEIIIVDDGSKDRTPEIADRLASEDAEHIKVVHHNPNKGYGAALWSGIQNARYEYVFFTDADLQFDLSELAILTHFVPDYKVVLGYRAPRRDPFLRKVNARMWNIVNRFLFGLRVKDIDCAFKLMHRDTVAKLPLMTRGAMMSAEMLIRMQHKGIIFKEIPVSHFPRLEGVATGANPKVIMRAVKELGVLYKSKLGEVSRQQLLRFAGIGVVNTMIDISTYFILTRNTLFFSEHLLIAKAFSFIYGTIFSFFANRIWTFKKESPIQFGEIVRFYLTVGAGLGINLISLSLFLDAFHLNDILGVVLATIITFIWNFIAMRLWVFKGNADTQPLIRKYQYQ